MNTAREGRLAVTAITFERDSSHIVVWALLLGLNSWRGPESDAAPAV